MPALLQAQEECELLRSRWFQSIAVGGGHRIIFFSGPVSFRCRGGVLLRADSAEHFQAQNETHMLGSVTYTDSLKTFTAQRANYLRSEQRIVAWGAVEVRDLEDGSVVTGDTLRYLRPTSQRLEDQMTVTGRRPRAVLYLRGDTAQAVDSPRTMAVAEPGERAPPPDTAVRPYDVQADRLVLAGNRYFEATGRVRIQRDSLRAYAESAEYDRAPERLTLAQAARIEGDDYELFGDTVVLHLPGGEVRDISAQGDALLTGERLRVAAPRVRLALAGGALERIYALATPAAGAAREAGPPAAEERAERAEAGMEEPDTAVAAGPDRPEAVAQDFLLRADSIEVETPARRLERVVAVGAAHGEAIKSDTVLGPHAPLLIRRDWLEGDTIIAFFTGSDSATGVAVRPDSARPSGTADGAAVGDTAREQVRVEKLIARGSARSLYRIVSADTVAPEGRCVSVHYVTGSEITITLEQGEVRQVSVRGPTRGVHLEPVPCGGTPPPVSERGQGGAGRANGPPSHAGTPSAPPPTAPGLAPGTPGGGREGRP